MSPYTRTHDVNIELVFRLNGTPLTFLFPLTVDAFHCVSHRWSVCGLCISHQTQGNPGRCRHGRWETLEEMHVNESDEIREQARSVDRVGGEGLSEIKCIQSSETNSFYHLRSFCQLRPVVSSLPSPLHHPTLLHAKKGKPSNSTEKRSHWTKTYHQFH